MGKLLVLLLVLVVGVAALGYWQGWFTVKKENGKVKVQTDPEKFKQDRKTFSKTVTEKAQEMKKAIANLFKKSKGLTGAEKAQTEKEIAELEKKRDRLEKQIKELDEAGEEKFEDIKRDLSQSLEKVEKKLAALTQRLEKR
jgi:hypothetical protein